MIYKSKNDFFCFPLDHIFSFFSPHFNVYFSIKSVALLKTEMIFFIFWLEHILLLTFSKRHPSQALLYSWKPRQTSICSSTNQPCCRKKKKKKYWLVRLPTLVRHTNSQIRFKIVEVCNQQERSSILIFGNLR